MTNVKTFVFRACECAFVIEAEGDVIPRFLTTTFGGLIAPPGTIPPEPARHYAVTRAASGSFGVKDFVGRQYHLRDASALMYFLDKEITLALQHQRPDLFFVHAAVVAVDGQVAVLAAPSGTGKSTLTWALTRQGFDYVSDELAPVDVNTFEVHPYARALILKRPTSAPHPLPGGVVEINGRLHVPLFRTVPYDGTIPLGAVFILRRSGGGGATCRPLTVASAASYLMANGLNLAAHWTSGLDIAIAIAQQVPRYELDSSDLEAACSAVKAVMSEASVRAQ